MSALDFVIEVLREHEKELNGLSEKLESMIKDLTEGKIKESLNEIQKNLEALLRSFEGIHQSLSSFRELDKTLSDSLKILENMIRSLKDVLEAIPSRAEIENLASGIRILQPPIPETVSRSLDEWADFKREASEANLIAYQVRGKNFCVKAFSRGIIYAYQESFPPPLEVKAGAQEHLQVRLRCGLSLTKIIERMDPTKGTVRVNFSIPKDVMLWLSSEFKVHPNSIVEGDILL
jgi:hypothetical protein